MSQPENPKQSSHYLEPVALCHLFPAFQRPMQTLRQTGYLFKHLLALGKIP